MLNALATTLVSNIPQRAAVVVPESTSLKEAVDRMRGAARGAVVVAGEDGAPVGILTQRDLVTRVPLGAPDWGRAAVSTAMTPNPTTVAEDATLAAALELMHTGGFRGLPVTGPDGRALGVLSIRDVLRHVAESFPAEFINLPPDPAHETRGPWGG